jgi:ribosomal protein S18 acetylase RimI-like enzyme
MMPDAGDIYEVIEGTWPPVSTHITGPWIIREGRGGGSRVSATTARQPVTADDLALAEDAMRALGQPLLFMIREGDTELDALLAAEGYTVFDPVNLYLAPVPAIAAERPPPVTCFTVWEPLEIMRDIWEAGGIGAGRQAVMQRAPLPKTGLFGRSNNSPAAAGFVALHKGIAMVHALEVLARHRRKGMGHHMMRQAAIWAMDQGATHISCVCRQENAAANQLYASLGMQLVGQYHYRKKE